MPKVFAVRLLLSTEAGKRVTLKKNCFLSVQGYKKSDDFPNTREKKKIIIIYTPGWPSKL